jgi:hypothetical protein
MSTGKTSGRRSRGRVRLKQKKTTRKGGLCADCALQGAVFLTPGEAASRLRISAITLAKWRLAGTGPVYFKFGRSVRYRLDHLMRWAKNHMKFSTSEEE